jgi:hypothetical protein
MVSNSFLDVKMVVYDMHYKSVVNLNTLKTLLRMSRVTDKILKSRLKMFFSEKL